MLILKQKFLKLGYPSILLDDIIAKYRSQIGIDRLKVFGPEKRKVLIKLPYIGTASVIIQRELLKLVSRFRPEIDLNIIYIGVKKIGHLFPNKE
jgi:hypothetical protein